MTLKVEIKSTETDTKSGTSKKGSPYSIKEQIGYLHLGGQVRELKIALRDGAMAWPVGVYLVDDSSFTTDSYDQLAIKRLVLKSAVSAQKPAAVA